jgi:dolichyl-phosphate-mannose--protein O-mannosyl transferase
MVLGVTILLGDMLGRRDNSEARRIIGLAAVCTYAALAVINFAWLWPVLTGSKITYAGWQARMWFSSWI